MSKGWDSIALKKLKALIGKGLSTSEIGRRLGMSKNAVVGKLNRLGWNAKAGGVTTAEAEEKKVAKKSKTEKVAENTKKTPVKKTEKKTTTKSEDTVSKKKGTEKAEKKVKSVKAVAEKNITESSSRVSEKSLATHQRIIQHSLEMASLKPNQCRWPIGDPDSEGFHFCGETVFVGKPYCYEHCKQAYQFAPPKKTSGK